MEQPLRAGETRRAELEGRFLSSLSDIERVIRFVARRHRLSRTEEDDFASEVKLALIENDYGVLARFEGHSSLRTYLTTVIQRLFLDYRCKLWGKWRPSAEAQRRGPLALRLESLLYRDGLSFDEAVETLRARFGATETRDEIAALAHALPARSSRRTSGDEALPHVPAGELANPEVQLEGADTALRLQHVLAEVMEELPAQDRIVLRMRFQDEVPIATIARTLCLDQKRLYRRLEAVLASFRKSVEARGVAWSDVSLMIQRGQCHLCLPKISVENDALRPSPETEAQA
jgi:RNA polymerase sigma factor (sigma-70 family)